MRLTQSIVDNRIRSPFWLFLIGYLSYCAVYMARLNLTVVAALLQTNGTLNHAQIGIIGSVFSFCYALSKIPNGFMGDRLNTKTVLVTGLVITGFSNLLIGFFLRYETMVVLWGINAFGQSMLWGVLLRSYRAFFDARTYQETVHRLISSVAVGSILGLLLASCCANAFGAAACFFVPGGIALLMAFIVLSFFPGVPGLNKTQSGASALLSVTRDLLHSQRFRSAIVPAMAHGMIKDNLNVWLAVFFSTVYHLDLASLRGFLFFIPLFALLGRLIYPFGCRLVQSELGLVKLSFLICAILNALLAFCHFGPYVSLLCMGLDMALVSLINTFLLSSFPSELAQDASDSLAYSASLMDLITYGGAGFGSILFGLSISHFGFSSMFLIWSVVSLLSLCFLPRLAH